MSEDLTQQLPDSRPFEERVLAELAAIRSGQTALETRMTVLEDRMTALEDRMTKFETRLTALEEKVDARLRETRPIWESMQQQLTTMDARMAAMEKTLTLIQVGLGELYGDSVEVRARIALLERERTSAG